MTGSPTPSSGLAPGTLPLVRESLKRDDLSVYARFDLAWSGVEPKMLEINGDTPTGLVESAVIQWNWLEDVFPDADQWNSVHDRLVKWWAEHLAAGDFPGNEAHFFNSGAETSGEEAMTVAYLRDTAAMAGLATYGHEIEDIGWDSARRAFVDWGGRPIRTAFKLYPWEDMLDDEFGRYVLAGLEPEPVRWIEPIWKTMLSTKAILPVLWELYPDHPNLLPAYFGDPGRPARVGGETAARPGGRQHPDPHRRRRRGPGPRRPVRHLDDGLPGVAPAAVVRGQPRRDRQLDRRRRRRRA